MGAAQVAAADRLMDDKQLTYVLAVWREWHRRSDTRLGYPPRAAGLHSATSQDFDSMCDAMDNTVAEAVDACVDDLAPLERRAVYAVVLGPATWSHSEPMQDVYVRARELLRTALRRRGIE